MTGLRQARSDSDSVNTLGYRPSNIRKARASNTQGYKSAAVIDAARIKERMEASGLSQAELARRVGVRQPTIFKLVTGGGYGSKHLHRIARELGTTPAYLTGEIDDPDEGAPPPAPAPTVQYVTLPVALPSEAALTGMFAGLLAASRRLDEDARARELAKRLPRALGALRGPLIEPASAEADGEPEPAEAPAGNRRALRRASRT